jgi:hypothetical protein
MVAIKHGRARDVERQYKLNIHRLQRHCIKKLYCEKVAEHLRALANSTVIQLEAKISL